MHLEAQVISGATNQVTADDAPAAHPTLSRLSTDGVGGTSEPDFNDLVISITANPVQ